MPSAASPRCIAPPPPHSQPTRLSAGKPPPPARPITANPPGLARARAAGDDDRPLGEIRPVALLDRGIEGVAVDMGDHEAGQLGMRDKARRAAFGATLRHCL